MKISVDKYHSMELKYHLFDIGKKDGVPIWDMIRVPLAYKYLYAYSNSSGQKVGRGFSVKLIIYWIKSILLLFNKNRFVFVSDPIGANADGMKIDPILYDMIDLCPEKDRLLLQHADILDHCVHDYYSINLVRIILRFFAKGYPEEIYKDDIQHIINGYKEFFGIDLPEQELINLIHYSFRERAVWILLLKWLKPKKLFVVGNHYPIYAAARQLNIDTYEFQHAGIMYEYLSYSYPREITCEDNLCWANHYVLFGSSWGLGNNIPADKIVLGNNIIRPTSFVNHFSKAYYLIISEIVHYKTLQRYAIEMAELCKDKLIIYKLHPKEYPKKAEYMDYFKSYDNITVVSNEFSLFDLIEYMQLMVLVYSSTFFEAMSLNKKVAVIKEDNYYVLNDFVNNNPNAKIVENVAEIIEFEKKAEEKSVYSIFDAFDKAKAKEIFVV